MMRCEWKWRINQSLLYSFRNKSAGKSFEGFCSLLRLFCVSQRKIKEKSWGYLIEVQASLQHEFLHTKAHVWCQSSTFSNLNRKISKNIWNAKLSVKFSKKTLIRSISKQKMCWNRNKHEICMTTGRRHSSVKCWPMTSSVHSLIRCKCFFMDIN